MCGFCDVWRARLHFFMLRNVMLVSMNSLKLETKEVIEGHILRFTILEIV
jgi:hypothetical protein